MKHIAQTVVDTGLSYEEYNRFMAKLVMQRATPEYSEEQINFTRMNIIRQERLDKTLKVYPSTLELISSIQIPLTWLVLTEPWCDDAAQVLPVLNKLQELNDLIELRMILRNRHLPVMDAFLTGNSRSIPMVLILKKESYEILGRWGPRPFIAQGMMLKGLEEYRNMEASKAKKLYYRDLMTKIQKWYARDKSSSIQEEFSEVLTHALA